MLIPTGRTIKFKVTPTGSFKKGSLVGVTDTSFMVRMKDEVVSVAYNELSILKTPKTTGRIIVKSLMIASGIALVLVSAGNSIGSKNSSSAPGTFGAMAIMGGVLYPARRTIDLKKSWLLKSSGGLKKNPSVRPNENQVEGPKKFRVEAGLGYGGHVDQSNPEGGLAFYVEPALKITESIKLGLKLESVSPRETNNSLSLNAEYYLSRNKFRPFIGAGAGYYFLQLDASQIASTNVQPGEGYQTFGFYPRFGFELKPFTVAIDYNFLPAQSVDVYDAANSYSYSSLRKYSYLGFKVGYFIEWGAKK